jgi:hypothetical protein
MNIKLTNIQNPTSEDRSCNLIKGTLPNGLPVEVTREVQGWDAVLRIKVDGRFYHSAVPSEVERNQWNQLRRQINDAKDYAKDHSDADACDAFNQYFL